VSNYSNLLEESEPPRKQMKKGDGDTPAAADDTLAAVEQKAVEDVKDKIGDTNEIGEALLCIICQELLHDCVRYAYLQSGSEE